MAPFSLDKAGDKSIKSGLVAFLNTVYGIFNSCSGQGQSFPHEEGKSEQNHLLSLDWNQFILHPGRIVFTV